MPLIHLQKMRLRQCSGYSIGEIAKIETWSISINWSKSGVHPLNSACGPVTQLEIRYKGDFSTFCFYKV
jgi:hypothetical protein